MNKHDDSPRPTRMPKPLQAPLRWGADGVTSPHEAFSLPVGTVTFLLTDIEGSTRHWASEDPEAMRAAVGLHLALIAEAVERNGGVRPQEQGEGDSTVAAFARPSQALRAARDAQLALAFAAWPTTHPLRVRMAVHTGEAQLRDDANYAGQAIIRTARLRGLGHGGQVLVSQATRDLAVDQLGEEIELVALGEYALRDLGRPEQVWQLNHGDLSSEFPALVSPMAAVPHNLPLSLSPFIGRQSEIATLATLVSRERLVTSTGSGGAGKTRLAQQVGAELLERFPDGVWWVELAPMTPGSVIEAVASVLKLREIRSDASAAVAGAIGSKTTLLVLDNCEHVVGSVQPLVNALLASCPNLHVLATSRLTLDLPGEIAWRIPPMSLPSSDQPLGADALSQFDAVQLFVDRARRARSSFAVDDLNAPAVAELCVRLDGIPLAIELAAARCRLLPPAQILAGLSDAFRLLAGGATTLMPRQQTIEASIVWSYDLLTPDEQRLLRRLSVFVDGWTLEAAEQICSDELLDSYVVFDLLDRLVNHSLIQSDDRHGAARFSFLETIRQFASRLLTGDPDDADHVRDQHARWYARWAQDRHDGFRSADAADLVAPLDQEQRNLDVAADRLADIDPIAAVNLLYATFPMLPLAPARIASTVLLTARLLERLGETAPARLWFVHAFANQYADSTNVAPHQRAAELADASGDNELAEYMRIAVLVLGLISATPKPDELRQALPRLSHADDRFLYGRALASAGLLSSMTGHLDLAHETLQLLSDMPERHHPAIAALADVALVGLHWHTGRPLDVLSEAKAAFRRRPSDIQGMNLYRWATLAALASGEPRPVELDEFRASAPQSIPLVSAIFRATDWLVNLCAGSREPFDHAVTISAGIGRLSELDYHAQLAGLRRGPLPAHTVFVNDPDGCEQLIAADEAERAGDLVRASAFVAETLAKVRASNGWGPGIVALEHTARIEAAAGDHRAAARIYGAVDAFREERHLYRYPFLEDANRPTYEAIRSALGPEADTAFAEGRELSLDQACVYATRQRAPHAVATTGWSALTPTERQVAELAAAGESNPQIARALLMSPETVKTHLSRVYAKLGVKNRQQLAYETARRST